MKFTKKLLIVMGLLAVMVAMPGTVYANDEISVTIDSQAVDFPGGQGPVIVDDRTLVPVRGVFEAMGFDVDWDGDTRTATLTSENHLVIITLDSDLFTTNGEEFTLEVPAQLIDGRTMLPIRAVLESVNYDVDWDGETRTVIITSALEAEVEAEPAEVNYEDDDTAELITYEDEDTDEDTDEAVTIAFGEGHVIIDGFPHWGLLYGVTVSPGTTETMIGALSTFSLMTMSQILYIQINTGGVIHINFSETLAENDMLVGVAEYFPDGAGGIEMDDETAVIALNFPDSRFVIYIDSEENRWFRIITFTLDEDGAPDQGSERFIFISPFVPDDSE